MSTNKLVSILIRSSNRKLITRALASVANQDYDHIEIIVLNTTGLEHSALEREYGKFSVELVNSTKKLNRPEAANKLTELAKGDYLLFLDDDDWIKENHISKLVTNIEANKDCVLAYTETELVNSSGQIINKYSFNLPAQAIIVANFLPIHSVLFKREILKQCRFDTSFDLYEDWDFWIQASRLGDFVFVPEVSAYYYLGNDNSSIQQYSVASKARLLVLRKWASLWNDDDLIYLSEQAESARQLKSLTEYNLALKTQLSHTESQLKKMIKIQQDLSQQHQDLAQLYSKTYSLYLKEKLKKEPIHIKILNFIRKKLS